MSATDKLKQLAAGCKCGVYVIINQHRDVYETAEQALGDLVNPPDIDPAVRAQMIATNTIVDVQFYPNTPIGSSQVMHHDLESALDEALVALEHYK